MKSRCRSVAAMIAAALAAAAMLTACGDADESSSKTAKSKQDSSSAVQQTEESKTETTTTTTTQTEQTTTTTEETTTTTTTATEATAEPQSGGQLLVPGVYKAAAGYYYAFCSDSTGRIYTDSGECFNITYSLDGDVLNVEPAEDSAFTGITATVKETGTGRLQLSYQNLDTSEEIEFTSYEPENFFVLSDDQLSSIVTQYYADMNIGVTAQAGKDESGNEYIEVSDNGRVVDMLYIDRASAKGKDKDGNAVDLSEYKTKLLNNK